MMWKKYGRTRQTLLPVICICHESIVVQDSLFVYSWLWPCISTKHTHGLQHFISTEKLLRERSTILRNTFFAYFIIIATDYISCEVRAED